MAKQRADLNELGKTAWHGLDVFDSAKTELLRRKIERIGGEGIAGIEGIEKSYEKIDRAPTQAREASQVRLKRKQLEAEEQKR